MPQGQPPQRYTQYPQPPYPQPGTDMMPSPKPRKKRWYRNWMIIGVIVLILLGTAGAYARYKITTSTNTVITNTHSTKSHATATPGHSTATSTSSKVTPTPTVTYLTFGDGTYHIGNDIQPAANIIKFGRYRTRTPSPGCHYTRIGDAGAVVADIKTDTTAIIMIKATDKEFKTQKCGTWTTDLSPITTSKTSFGDGMYFVGTDIEPGIYQSTGGSACQYARLQGFDGTQSEILPKNPTDTATTVTILLTDKGFQSNGCGTWTKQGNGA